nr:coiled-coil domain-containing protein 1-like [Leptinotarsa decemlineata]
MSTTQKTDSTTGPQLEPQLEPQSESRASDCRILPFQLSDDDDDDSNVDMEVDSTREPHRGPSSSCSLDYRVQVLHVTSTDDRKRSDIEYPDNNMDTDPDAAARWSRRQAFMYLWELYINSDDDFTTFAEYLQPIYDFPDDFPERIEERMQEEVDAELEMGVDELDDLEDDELDDYVDDIISILSDSDDHEDDIISISSDTDDSDNDTIINVSDDEER